MQLLTPTLAVAALVSVAQATLVVRNFTSSPVAAPDLWGFNDPTLWHIGQYGGTPPDSLASFTNVYYTDSPDENVIFRPGNGGILALDVVGAFKKDRGEFYVTLLANGSASSTARVTAHATDGDDTLHSLYSFVGLDLYTTYSLVLGNVGSTIDGKASYFAFSGVIVTSYLDVDDGASTVSIDADPNPIYPKAGAQTVRTDLGVGPYTGIPAAAVVTTSAPTPSPTTSSTTTTSRSTTSAAGQSGGGGTTTTTPGGVSCSGGMRARSYIASYTSSTVISVYSSGASTYSQTYVTAVPVHKRLARACEIILPTTSSGASSLKPTFAPALGGWMGLVVAAGAGGAAVVLAGWV
ncbi:hypothetical protein JCM6882_004728 [Rhodosporidiobolus microsporus]